MSWNDVRTRTGTWHVQAHETLLGRVLVSLGFAGFLGLMALISFPLPWTPVPFSMMPFALLVAGGYQRPGFAAMSVLIYLVAGALGAPIYANGSSGWEHLFGSTGGYLFGFVLVSAFAGWYMQRRRSLLPTRTMLWLGALVGVLVVAGIAVIAWMVRQDTGLEDWGVTSSTLWVLAGIVAVCGMLTWLALGRHEGRPQQAWNLFFVHLGALAVLHVCGFTVLWLATDLSLVQAIALGSIVFLPFDIVKAGLGVAATLPFLPETPEARHA